MAYLGKISAVIAANTQDFTKNIGLAKKELTDFSKKVQGIRLNLDTNALDKTLTRLQKFQREVQTIQKLLGKGVDLGFDSKKLNDQFKAFEDIGRPLTKLKDQIEGLSSSLQAELYPELGKIQKGFQNLHNDIGSGVAQYDKSEKRVESLRQALVRLGRATSAAADFGRLAQSLDANNSGASFFQPRAKQALQQSLSLRGQAEQVPARFRGGAFADLAVSAEENANKIEQQAGRIARIQLEIARNGQSQGRSTALAQAEGQLDALTGRQEAINAAFSRQLRGARIAEIVSPEAVSTVDTLVSRLASLSSQLRAINGQQFEGLISGAARAVSQFNAGETSAKNAKKAVDALASALNSVNTGRSLSQRLGSQLFTDFERQQQRIQSDFDKQSAAKNPAARVNRDASLGRLNLSENIIPAARRLESQAADTGDVKLQRRAQKLIESSRQIRNEFDKAQNLAASGREKDVKKAEAGLARVNALVAKQSADYRKLAEDIQTANEARSQQNLFLEASGGRGEKLSQGARDAAADISTARQFRGQIASGASRIAIDSEINRVTASVTALQNRMAEVASSTLAADKKVAELDRLDNQIRQSTAGLAAFVASFSGGAFNTQQIQKAMEMARNTAGSLSARSGQVAQLAFQQALFAIDDLISSTGGLEYKLRAVGNNITQLGLLLGQSGVIPGLSATTGLFVGLATVLGGQAISAMLRWATSAELADEKTKALNDSLSKQRSLAEDLAKSYDSLAESIARAGASDVGQRRQDREKTISDIRNRAEAARAEAIGSLSPDVTRIRGERALLEKDLEKESDLQRRLAIQNDIERNRRREREAIARGVPAPTSEETKSQLVAAANEQVRQTQVRLNRARLREQLGGQAPPGEEVATLEAELQRRRREAAQAAARGAPGDRQERLSALRESRAEAEKQRERVIASGARTTEIDKVIDDLANSISRIEASFSPEVQAVVETVTRSALLVADSLASGQKIIAEAFDGGGSAIQAEMDRTAETLAMLQKSASEASTPEEAAAFKQDIAALQEHANALTAAAMAVRAFSQEFGRLSESFASDVSSFEQMASDARREDLRESTPETRRNRAQAEKEADDARRRQREFEDNQATARERVERQVMVNGQPAMERLRQINEQLALGVGEIGANGVNGGTVEERDALRAERRALQAQIDAQVARDPDVARSRESADAITREIEGRRRLIEVLERQRQFDEEVENRRKPKGDPMRGLDLAESPAQRAQRETRQGLADINAAFREIGRKLVDEAGGLFDIDANERKKLDENEANRRKAIDDFMEQRMRQEAPMIMGMVDARQNALLQGPSRAAINVSDVSTMQGQSELNRLLRGDDANKNVDLVNLQREANRLLGVIAEKEAAVAN